MFDDALLVLLLAGMCLSMLYLYGALRSRRVRRRVAEAMDEQ